MAFFLMFLFCSFSGTTFALLQACPRRPRETNTSHMCSTWATQWSAHSFFHISFLAPCTLLSGWKRVHNSVEDFALRCGCLPSCHHSCLRFYADESLPRGCWGHSVAQDTYVLQLRREGWGEGDSRHHSDWVGRSGFIITHFNITLTLHQMLTPCSCLHCTTLYSPGSAVLVYTVLFINCGSSLRVYRSI